MCVWAGVYVVGVKCVCVVSAREDEFLDRNPEGDDDNGNDNRQIEYRFERTKQMQYGRLANRTERYNM